MKKGNLRVITVDSEKYQWIVDEKEVRIYDEAKKMHRIAKSEISSLDYDSDYDDFGTIRPGKIRIWMKNNLNK